MQAGIVGDSLNVTPYQILQATSVFLAAVLVFGYASLRRRFSVEAEQNRVKQQRLSILTQESNALQSELARKGEIADLFPIITKTITEKLPPSAVPAIAVRIAKDLFHSNQVGFFVAVKDSAHFMLEVGVGFPPDWQGKILIPSNEGILGVSLLKKTVISRIDFPPSFNRASSRKSLEHLGVIPDFVAPVFGVTGISGVLVIAGCPFPLEEERKFVSMLTDLVSTSLQKNILMESGENSVWADHLTGVANRMFFSQRFESELRRTENYRQSLALYMLDIDHFKKINDNYGHLSGDVAIKKVAEIIRSNTRSSDLVGRYGGDEFTVLINSTTQEQAVAYAENLRIKICDAEIRIPGHGTPLRMSISGGLAMYPPHGLSTSDLFLVADRALYDAKRKGRNQTVLASVSGLDSTFAHEQGEECGITVPANQEEDCAARGER